MERYHIDRKDCTGLVATEAEHLGAVRKAICDHIGPQSRLMALHEAHYLGCTLNISGLPRRVSDVGSDRGLGA